MNPGQIVNRIQAERPSWQTAGVVAAVRKAIELHSPELVLRAGLAAARDPGVQTPGVIPARCEIEAERIKRAERPPLADVLTEAGNLPTNLPPGHCGRRSCGCEHRLCDAGWLEADPDTGEITSPEDAIYPCPTCRPALAERVQSERRRRAELAELAVQHNRRCNPAIQAEIRQGIRAQLAARKLSNTPTPQQESA